MALFRLGDFTLHSGEKSAWKIDCDALTDKDWMTLAVLLHERVGRFNAALGIPRGGCRLADALNAIADGSGPLLLVDDVLTTGRSMERARCRLVGAGNQVRGAVVFSRGPVPEWITPLFVLTAAPEASGRSDSGET